MNHEIQDLARRAVACKRWRWMPGMAGCQGERVLDVSISGSATVVDFEYHDPRWTLPDEALPDLTDPATLGCLLALVLEIYPCGVSLGHTPFAAGSRRWHESQRVSFCVRLEDDTERFSRYGSIAEALVAALEAAP